MTGIDRVLDRSDPPDPDPTAVIGSGWLVARLGATLAARRAALRAGGRWRRWRMAGAVESGALGHGLARELDGELARVLGRPMELTARSRGPGVRSATVHGGGGW